MKLICPWCLNEQKATLKQVRSGKPISCLNCHQDLHLSKSKLALKGEQK